MAKFKITELKEGQVLDLEKSTDKGETTIRKTIGRLGPRYVQFKGMNSWYSYTEYPGIILFSCGNKMYRLPVDNKLD